MSVVKNTSQRIAALDVFRGIIIATMILVNSPGYNTAYSQLIHSDWNGCTIADLVFPSFLFIVGVSIVFSFTNSVTDKEPKQIILKILKRSFILFLLGVLLNTFPTHEFAYIRVMGVLQRIAICYCFTTFLFLISSLRTRIIIIFGILLSYWLILNNNFSENNNIVAYVDQLVLSTHTYTLNYDPEGLLSTFPALVTCLLGTLAGQWLQTKNSPQVKMLLLLASGLTMLILGQIWNIWLPINKTLWTSSFVFWAGGFACILLAVCYWIIDIKHWQCWSIPFEIFGLNSIAAYILHIMLLKIQNHFGWRIYITEHLFSFAPAKIASLFYALTYLGLWLLFFWILYRKKIFIKI